MILPAKAEYTFTQVNQEVISLSIENQMGVKTIGKAIKRAKLPHLEYLMISFNPKSIAKTANHINQLWSGIDSK